MNDYDWAKKMTEDAHRRIQQIKDQKKLENLLSEARNTKTIMSPTTILKRILPGQLFVRLDHSNSISNRIYICLDHTDPRITIKGGRPDPRYIPVTRINVIGNDNTYGQIDYLLDDQKVALLDMDLFDGDNLVTSSYQA